MTSLFPGPVNIDGRKTFSPLQAIGKERALLLPAVLASPALRLEAKEALGAVADHADIEERFPSTYGRPRVVLEADPSGVASTTPLRVGVILSGGQAPGGHNVISGIYDYIKKISPQSEMVGFLNGPQGLYNAEYCFVSDEMMDSFRNSGGFDMIGSGRHKIEKEEHFKASMATCMALKLDGVVIIGGDDSNTNGAVLAEYFEANKCPTRVCGAPKTIDGDLKVDPYIPISFGFDTACRTYSELIGNVGQDTLSSQKYYHFVRLMGRAASNIALECALQTRPNICLISEEVEAKQSTLMQITKEVVDVIVQRSEESNKNYGMILLPEGLIEFLPEFNTLIADINEALAAGAEATEAAMLSALAPANQLVFSYLPDNIKQQLLLDRDPHGNVQVAKIETEKLLAQTVALELEQLAREGKYSGQFSPQFHSYGYEGRSCIPSSFDATYCYALGQNVAALLAQGCTGLISSVTNLTAPVTEWVCGGVPITMLCHMERRHGRMKPVIKKALVELQGAPFRCFAAQRAAWAKYDLYRSPGPIQFFELGDRVELAITLTLELLGEDTRMGLEAIDAAARIQSGGVMYGPHIHAPLVGAGGLSTMSVCQQARVRVQPELCAALADRSRALTSCVCSQPTQCTNPMDRLKLQALFPVSYSSELVNITAEAEAEGEGGDEDLLQRKKRRRMLTREPGAPLTVGVCFCGRQAPGGHDIIAGILDALPAGSTLIGFVGGTEGLFAGHAVTLTPEVIANYRGQGGFDLLGRSVDRLQGLQSYKAVTSVCHTLGLNGLVLLGGSKTATDAAHFAEYLLQQNIVDTTVVCVPLTITGSIQNQFVEATVGFDTASKLTAQIVGNNQTDGASAKKYYYFQRLMGQEPSHLALEVALATKPNFTLIAEEIEQSNQTLADIVKSLADMVEARARAGKHYGSVVIPEGLIESIPEIKLLLQELDAAYASNSQFSSEEGGGECREKTKEGLRQELTLWSRALLDSLPDFLQAQLLWQRTHANRVDVSQAETERLLAHFVSLELEHRKRRGTYSGSFSVVCSFIGYQARGAMPSNFDVNYAYNLGAVATVLIANDLCGYMATLHGLKGAVRQWQAGGVPLTALMTATPAGGAVVPNAKIDLQSASYQSFAQRKAHWAVEDCYENPGPVQFKGPTALLGTETLRLESFDYLHEVRGLHAALDRITQQCRPGCSSGVLRAATGSLGALAEVLDLVCAAESGKRKK